MNDSHKAKVRVDAKLLQIKNSIESEILPSINHYESVKELIKYLEYKERKYLVFTRFAKPSIVRKNKTNHLRIIL